MLPPSVYVGNMVNFVGRFMTLNEGKSFWVLDALPFNGKYQDVVRPGHKYILAHCDDPRDWLEKRALDRLRLEDSDSR